MKVGFIGLGDQGGPMADMILSAGHDLGVWARRKAVMDDYAARSARVAASPADLASACEMMCLCVTDDADVRELVFDGGVLEALPKGAILVTHATINPATCRDIARAASARGVRVLDAPVSGSGHAARSRTLLVMAGGDASVLEACRSVFESYAGRIIHLGGHGAGMTAKLINNMMMLVNIGRGYQALKLGQAAGLDPWALWEVICAGSGASRGFEIIKDLSDSDRAGHVLKLFSKDAALALDGLPDDSIAPWRGLMQDGLDAIQALADGVSGLK